MDRTGAQVRLIPPLVVFVPLTVLLAMNALVPWAIGVPLVIRVVVGALLVVVGVALMAWAASVMKGQGTTVIPWEQVDALVTSGPFAFTRNPIYLGDGLVYLGITVAFGSWWPALGLPVVLLVLHRYVIDPEEAYLTVRFGPAYTTYAGRVRRWL
ncbi:MAG: isoprenylcysteine carboxylmethyltransferase family protein [Dermatophilaceae bacterium]